VKRSGTEESLVKQRLRSLDSASLQSRWHPSLCHSERSRGISCQTTVEISPLRFAPVEMTSKSMSFRA